MSTVQKNSLVDFVNRGYLGSPPPIAVEAIVDGKAIEGPLFRIERRLNATRFQFIPAQFPASMMPEGSKGKDSVAIVLILLE